MPLHRIGDVLLRIIVLGGLLAVWYGFDWNAAQRLSARLAMLLLEPFCEVAVWAGPVIVCDGVPFPMSKECTYLDLFLATAPFAWRTPLGTVHNLRRLFLLFLVISIVNTLRLAGAVGAAVHGVGWALAHDLPDLLLYWPTLGLVLAAYGYNLTASGGTAR